MTLNEEQREVLRLELALHENSCYWACIDSAEKLRKAMQDYKAKKDLVSWRELASKTANMIIACEEMAMYLGYGNVETFVAQEIDELAHELHKEV